VQAKKKAKEPARAKPVEKPAKPPVRSRDELEAAGRAIYSFDVGLPRLLHGAVVRCPHPHARLRAIDGAAAAALPGVRAVQPVREAGSEIAWAGDEVALVVAETPRQAAEGAQAVRVDWEVLPFAAPDLFGAPPGDDRFGAVERVGDAEAALKGAAFRVEATYGWLATAAAPWEPAVWVCEAERDHLTVWASCDDPARLAADLGTALGTPGRVKVVAEHVGRTDSGAARLPRSLVELARQARKLGRPVRLARSRREEIADSGHRAATFAAVALAATAEGSLVAWRSRLWEPGGDETLPVPRLPVAFRIPACGTRSATPKAHLPPPSAPRGGSEAAASYLTSCALDDVAAVVGLDPFDVVVQNLSIAGPGGAHGDRWRAVLDAAEKLFGWKAAWHPRGGSSGVGLGLGLGEVSGSLAIAMAAAAVDRDTGLVRVERIAVVADGPAEIAADNAAAEAALVRGAWQGVSQALFEEWSIDPATGLLASADACAYRIAGNEALGEVKAQVIGVEAAAFAAGGGGGDSRDKKELGREKGSEAGTPLAPPAPQPPPIPPGKVAAITSPQPPALDVRSAPPSLLDALLAQSAPQPPRYLPEAASATTSPFAAAFPVAPEPPPPSTPRPPEPPPRTRPSALPAPPFSSPGDFRLAARVAVPGAVANAVADALGVRVPVLPLSPARVLAAIAAGAAAGAKK
jgi:CO/xanthine dehydrogenase Mo-binding subunit